MENGTETNWTLCLFTKQLRKYVDMKNILIKINETVMETRYRQKCKKTKSGLVTATIID